MSTDQDIPLNLEDHLKRLVRATKLTLGRQTPEHQALREALAHDPDMIAEARAKLEKLTPALMERDHISRWYHDTLTGALPQERL